MNEEHFKMAEEVMTSPMKASQTVDSITGTGTSVIQHFRFHFYSRMLGPVHPSVPDAQSFARVLCCRYSSSFSGTLLSCSKNRHDPDQEKKGLVPT